ncbi:Adenylate cyclase, class 3 [Enhydrobacter aerosaccus]|uniref:Adenylate cyclase, class 3 n=1 Tax=Enhydrobacter aerosaccus TaxID=225324 RepID=A0A1T4RLU3_9HYPH|nr:adenylate/guanylate cyclase domain-containing protein [Enhydrobacter aerosaccus]SKA16718.1 Adenylate cyclase, class 3 [Enhydrobacter aerosaccus]
MTASAAPATAAEIGVIRRRYFWMALSVAGLDILVAIIFIVVHDAWVAAPSSLAASLLVMGGLQYLLCRRLFAPIQRYLDGEQSFDETQRRLTQLPLLTARNVAILEFVLTAYRQAIGYLPSAAALGILPPTIADLIVVTIVLPIFYFTYTYFVVSDYLAQLCTFISRHYGRTLELFFGSYPLKLLVALMAISLAPLSAIIVDLFSYTGDRLQREITNDVGVAVLGIAITAYFIIRTLLRPLGILSNAMTKVAGGDLDIRVPVTSNDEIGELTRQFNAMVEGLRERERIRETFGRYVDENVAATILRRQGDGQRSAEMAEATILFTDIAGFTTIAEHLDPPDLVAALNAYLETVLAPIRDHGGIVNTFIGDGLFASFNMPLACHDHPAAAVRAAIDIQRAVSSRRFGDHQVAFPTRIGISTGAVIGGDVGAGKRLSFTLLGDTVNLAARLEELNKEYGTRILVSERTCQACGEGFTFTPLGTVAVRGRSDPANIYSIDPCHQESLP